MKTTPIIFFAIICFAIGCCNRSHAQDSTEPTRKIIERSIGGQTYIYVYYDSLSFVTIHNKKNYIDSIKEPYCERYNGDTMEPLDNIFNKIFSAERKKELKGKTLGMIFYCDASGNVLEIIFRSRYLSMITLEEVYALENALLKYKLKMRGTCPDKKYYLFMVPYRGWLERR